MGDVVSAVTNPIGAVTGLLSGNGINGQGSGPIAGPPIDPRLTEMQKRQTDAANKFRADLPSMKEAQGSMAADESRQAVNQQKQDLQAQASKRGLLYSGLRQGAEAGIGAQAASGLARTRAGINQNLENQASQMESQALGSAYGMANQQMKGSDFAYNLALQERQGRAQAMGQLGKGMGGLLGGIAGRQPSGGAAEAPVNNTGTQTTGGRYSPVMTSR